MTVLYSKTTWEYLHELTEILYREQYFSYKNTVLQYVFSLIKEMEATIPFKQKYEAPDRFSRYGKNLYYVCYPKSKRTTWYFFFTYHPDNDVYYIRYITNNHIAGHLLL